MKYSIIRRDCITGSETLIETYNTELNYLLFQRVSELEETTLKLKELIVRDSKGNLVFEE